MKKTGFCELALPLLAILLASGQQGLAQEASEGRVGAIEAPQYFAVLVSDVEASALWYKATFGLEELDDTEAEDGAWRIVNLRNERLLVEIIHDKRARDCGRSLGFFKVGFGVPDVDVVAERAERHGGERPRVLEFARYGIRLLQLRDPDGNIIQLTSKLK